MKVLIDCFFYSFMVLILSGCAGLKTRQQIKDTSNVSQEPSIHAQITELETNMREFNGRLESFEHRLEQAQQKPSSPSEEILTEIRQLKSQIDQLSEKVKVLEKNIFITTKTSPQTLQYLEAEDLFKKKQWQNAILAYERYRSQNPNGQHWTDATFKIAVSFQELQLHQEARAFYTELINKKPKSQEARKAKVRLGELQSK